MKTLRIGAGAGYSGDRIPPAAELAEKGELDYLVFECLAERTIALAQLERSKDSHLGFDPLLADRMEAVLASCVRQGVKIITNMGAANPEAAGREIIRVARTLGLERLQIAVSTVIRGLQTSPEYLRQVKCTSWNSIQIDARRSVSG